MAPQQQETRVYANRHPARGLPAGARHYVHDDLTSVAAERLGHSIGEARNAGPVEVFGVGVLVHFGHGIGALGGNRPIVRGR